MERELTEAERDEVLCHCSNGHSFKYKEIDWNHAVFSGWCPKCGVSAHWLKQGECEDCKQLKKGECPKFPGRVVRE